MAARQGGEEAFDIDCLRSQSILDVWLTMYATNMNMHAVQRERTLNINQTGFFNSCPTPEHLRETYAINSQASGEDRVTQLRSPIFATILPIHFSVSSVQPLPHQDRDGKVFKDRAKGVVIAKCCSEAKEVNSIRNPNGFANKKT
uniref:Uncharacterized protein n=1 Tax=Glossina pallidipes TaxID=7398 RepID=A0A1A9Z9C3_GLOPL